MWESALLELFPLRNPSPQPSFPLPSWPKLSNFSCQWWSWNIKQLVCVLTVLPPPVWSSPTSGDCVSCSKLGIWSTELGLFTLESGEERGGCDHLPLHDPDKFQAPSTNNNNYEIWCDKFVQLILRALAQYKSLSEFPNKRLYQFYTSYTSDYTSYTRC